MIYFYKKLTEAVEKLGAAASHWDEMKVDQRQSDAKALGWDESAGKLLWNDLTKEQQAAYEKHYSLEN